MFLPMPAVQMLPECFDAPDKSSQAEAVPQRFTLREEVRSCFNPKCVYGAKNTIVTLVKQTGSVSIVERADGERFPVGSEKLKPIAAGPRHAS